MVECGHWYFSTNCYSCDTCFSDSFTSTKNHPVSDQKHKPVVYDTKHQGTSKPAWLLALEIVTGTMVGSLFLVAILTAMQRCNSKASIIIPWKKSASEKDHITVYIGQVSNYICINAIEVFELLYLKEGIYFFAVITLQILRCWKM